MITFKAKIWKGVPKWFKRSKMANKRYKSNDYMLVYLFDTFEEMYDEVSKIEGVDDRDYLAKTWCFTKLFLFAGEVDGYSAHCGNMYFCKEGLDAKNIIHESTHAIIGYFNRKIENYGELFNNDYADDNFDDYTDNLSKDSVEELFCYMVGEFSMNLFIKLNDIMRWEDDEQKD